MTHPIVVSFGGGTNSTAMLIGMVDCEVRPDAILFADTGGERPEVYEHIRVFSDWLLAKGFPAIEWVRKETQTLEQECLDAATLPSKAFGFPSCSDQYKIRPQTKWLNQWQPAIDCWAAGGKVMKFIGFDAGPDSRRAKEFVSEKYVNCYPLISWGWDRPKCVEVCQREGFTPRKSSCFFCPNAKKPEVTQLAKEHPDLMARAIAMEENAKPNMQTVKGLGRSWSWKALVENDQRQEKLWSDDGAEDLPCGCYDG